MTFDQWWDITKAASTPDTFAGWEHSCRQAWAAAAKVERQRWRDALLSCRGSVKSDLLRYETMATRMDGYPMGKVCEDEANRLQALLDLIDSQP
jgi:hypothetical protein